MAGAAIAALPALAGAAGAGAAGTAAGASTAAGLGAGAAGTAAGSGLGSTLMSALQNVPVAKQGMDLAGGMQGGNPLNMLLKPPTPNKNKTQDVDYLSGWLK